MFTRRYASLRCSRSLVLLFPLFVGRLPLAEQSCNSGAPVLSLPLFVGRLPLAEQSCNSGGMCSAPVLRFSHSRSSSAVCRWPSNPATPVECAPLRYSRSLVLLFPLFVGRLPLAEQSCNSGGMCSAPVLRFAHSPFLLPHHPNFSLFLISRTSLGFSSRHSPRRTPCIVRPPYDVRLSFLTK